MTSRLRHRCDDCRMVDADFQAEYRRTRPGTTDHTRGLQAPWVTRWLCEPCCKEAIRSDDPPRKITALPGYKPRHPAPPPAPKNMTLGSDWGTTA